MGSEQIIFNNTLHYVVNITNAGGSIKEMCEINALSMLESVNKTPQYAFLFLIVALILLTIYLFYINKSSNEWIQNNLKKDFIILPYLLVLASSYLYLFTTYDIDTKKFFSIVEPVMIGIAFILALYSLYGYYKEHYGK